jgi:hypothetical protein
VVGRLWNLKPGDPIGTVYLTASGWYFEGKVGLCPVVEYGWTSPRNSANARNSSFTCIKVNQAFYEKFMIEDVLPLLV